MIVKQLDPTRTGNDSWYFKQNLIETYVSRPTKQTGRHGNTDKVMSSSSLYVHLVWSYDEP
jgi:hypothetical protein